MVESHYDSCLCLKLYITPTHCLLAKSSNMVKPDVSGGQV